MCPNALSVPVPEKAYLTFKYATSDATLFTRILPPVIVKLPDGLEIPGELTLSNDSIRLSGAFIASTVSHNIIRCSVKLIVDVNIVWKI
jgi:hypothetical protein